jgi:hypothetical protein
MPGELAPLVDCCANADCPASANAADSADAKSAWRAMRVFIESPP